MVYPGQPAASLPDESFPLKRIEAGINLAHRWAEGMRQGRWKTLADVAQAHRVSVARVSQLLPLSLFAVCDLMVAAQGMERPSLRKLIAWARQHAKNVPGNAAESLRH